MLFAKALIMCVSDGWDWDYFSATRSVDGHQAFGAFVTRAADGSKNWSFCWTELGAKHVGVVQSLIATCRVHGIGTPVSSWAEELWRVLVRGGATETVF